MGSPGRTVEEELARIAGGAHGVVTRTELLHAGVTPKEITLRLRNGALLREHRGVYRVGHRAPSIEATYLAAVLAAGEGALLSGRAAAHLFEIVKGAPPGPEVITRTERRIEGVQDPSVACPRCPGGDDRPRDSRNDRAAHARRPRRRPLPRCSRSSLPRGRGPLPRHAFGGRGRARATAEQPGREEAPPSYSRRRSRDAQQARSPFSGAAPTRRTSASDYQPPGGRPPRGLPLAGAPADRRARRLPVPQLPSLMGAGPAP